MENQLSKTPQTKLLNELSPGAVLCEQPDALIKVELCDLLDQISILYQIPNWQELNSVLLADWILEEYPKEPLEVIRGALKRPSSKDKTWRLTPDTIKEWVTNESERYAAAREREQAKIKALEPREFVGDDERTKKWLKILRDSIEASEGFKSPPRMTAKEIREQGREKAGFQKVAPYPTDTPEMVERRARHLEYIRANYDYKTGKPNTDWMNEKAWIKKVYGKN